MRKENKKTSILCSAHLGEAKGVKEAKRSLWGDVGAARGSEAEGSVFLWGCLFLRGVFAREPEPNKKGRGGESRLRTASKGGTSQFIFYGCKGSWPERQARSRTHGAGRRCSWPSHPRRFRSDHPISQTSDHKQKEKCQRTCTHQSATHMTRGHTHDTCENLTWKNIPMMAIIANLPFANSAESFLVFSAGSLEVKTLKPKSPTAAAVPAD